MMKNSKNFVIKSIICILIIILASLIFYKIIITNSNIEFYLNGEKEVLVEYGSTYKDDGFIAKLNDNNINHKVKVISNVNTNKIGNYEVTYSLNLNLLNFNKKINRKVKVVDTTKPVISIEGENDIYIDVYSNFELPKYESIDNFDGDITSNVVIDSNVNVNKVGDYEVKLISTDSNNNEAIETILVHVEPKYKNAYISISISKQKLEYFERGNLILTSDIVTGAHNSSPVGTYKVLSKARNVNLQGADYVSFVNYWIAFLGYSYGMHDASWRNNFGGNIYTYNGSHGCVNMPYYKVQQLYGLVEIGTPVYIKN